ncbi:MAG: ion transporter [Bacillota bacterium]
MRNKAKAVYEVFILILAFIAVIITLLDIFGKISIDNSQFLLYLDYAILVVFAADYCVRFYLAEDKKAFFKGNIFDLIAIIPFNSLFRIFRAARMLRALKITKIFRVLRFISYFLRFSHKFNGFIKTNGFIYSVYITIVIVIFGAIGIYFVEKGSTISSFYDALWWSFVTATTVGYGDISPATNIGRLIAAILMIVGIGFISMLTGTIATYFLNNGQKKVEKTDNAGLDLSDLNKSEIEQIRLFVEFLRSKRNKT